LAAEAVTAMSAASAGGGVVLVLVVGVGVGVGVEVGGLVALTELPPEPEPPLEPVLLGVGVGVALVVGSLALGELALGELALGELALGVLDAWVAVALLEAEALAAAEELAVEELDERADAEGLADADGETAAMAVPVTPLVITNRPVARPTVAGRECADRMRTPCLWWLSRLENVPSRTLRHSGCLGWLLIAYVPIRHQNRRLVHPCTIRSPKSLPPRRRALHLPAVQPARESPGLKFRRFHFPVRFPSMPICPQKDRSVSPWPPWAGRPRPGSRPPPDTAAGAHEHRGQHHLDQERATPR
jgi:hypothetical protein